MKEDEINTIINKGSEFMNKLRLISIAGLILLLLGFFGSYVGIDLGKAAVNTIMLLGVLLLLVTEYSIRRSR
ncbi:hypothetical protein D3C81_2306350 [compost metagenome]